MSIVYKINVPLGAITVATLRAGVSQGEIMKAADAANAPPDAQITIGPDRDFSPQGLEGESSPLIAQIQWWVEQDGR